MAGPLQRLRTAFAPPPRRTLTAASRPAAASLPPVGSLPVNAQGSASALGGRRTVGQTWQLDAQAYFDTLGCIKYAARYVGNAHARIVLYPAVVVTDDENPVGVTDLLTDAGPPSEGGDGEGTPLPVPEDLLRQAQVEMARVRSSVDGQAGILRDIGVNFTITGECYACCRPETPTARETWDIYSVSEMVRRDPDPLTGAERWALRGDGMTLDRPLPDDAFVRRLYWPHPFRKQLADSPLRGILDDLEELALLNRSIRSTAKSRIAGSGIFLVPNELDYDTYNPLDPDGTDQLTRDLAIHLQAPLSDEGSAANVVPHIMRGPSEHLKNVRHLRFDRPIDKDLAEQRKEKLNSVAIGLEMPPEVLLGVGDVNHWGSYQIAEETFKAHIEPGIIVVAAQFGSQILQALLTAHDKWLPADIARITCWYDATALINHPDQSKSAMDAYNVIELSGDALRKYMGFLDDDKPSDDEVAAHIERFRLMHSRGAEPGVIPTGDVNAPVGGQVLPTAVPGMAPASAQQPVNPGVPPAPGPASTGGPPARTAALVAAARQPRPLGARLAELDQRLAARVQGAADMATRRLLEKAGGRITSAAAKNRELAATARSVPKAQVASTLGRTVVASLGVDDTSLLDGGYDELLDDVDSWVEQTRAQSRAMIAAWLRQHGVTVSAAALAELAGYDQQDSQAGRQALAAALLAYATARLYRTDMPGQDLGEGFADGSLPAGVTRRPLGVYGGQDVGQVGALDARGAVIPLRGVASGDRQLSFLASNGASTGAWMWVHGSPQHPFEPHELLDGEVFGDDPVADEHLLANTTDTWTGLPNYSVGDHDGCSCSAVDLVIAPGQSVDQAA